LKEAPLQRVQRYPHRRVKWKAVPTQRDFYYLDKFFTENVRSIELFHAGFTCGPYPHGMGFLLKLAGVETGGELVRNLRKIKATTA